MLSGLPSASGRYYSDRDLEFSGTVSDAEDSQMLAVSWTSSLDGDLNVSSELDDEGRHSGFSSLSEGAHVIVFSVEDSFGNVTTDSVEVSVFGANQPPQCSFLYPEEGQGFVYGEGVFFSAEVSDLEEGKQLSVPEHITQRDSLDQTPPEAGSTAVFA